MKHNFGIVGKRGAELRVLPEIRIFLHVDLLSHPLDSCAGAREALDLDGEVSQVVAEAGDGLARADLEVASDEMFSRQLEDGVESANPVPGAALIHGGRAVGEIEIASGNGVLPGEVDIDISQGVRRARSDELDGIIIQIDNHLLDKSLGGDAKRGLGRRWTGGLGLALAHLLDE